jgi:hypothetical protein
MRSFFAILAVAALVMACNEIPQDAAKPFADRAETKADPAKLAERTKVQDEYLRTGGAGPSAGGKQ